MPYLLTLLFTLLITTTAYATCSTFDLVDWTQQERLIFPYAASKTLNQPAHVQRQKGTFYTLCSEADTTTLFLPDLRTLIQSYLATKSTLSETKRQEKLLARTKFDANDLCKATYDEVSTRLNTMRANNNDAINAASNLEELKSSLIQASNRLTIALGKLAECTLARAIEKD